MAIATSITIGTTTYNDASRAANLFVGIDQLTISTDNYWELEFTVQGCGPTPPFAANQPVSLSVDIGDGAGLVVRFRGNIVEAPVGHNESGWTFSYRCLDLKRRGDRVPIIAADGSAVCCYNLPGDATDYDPTKAGKNVGQIVLDVLQNPILAPMLGLRGIGGYTIAGSTYTISSVTSGDLALLTIVPQSEVRIEGAACLGRIEQFVRDYHPQMSLWVDQAGIIRVQSPLNFVSSVKTLTLPAPGVTSPDLAEKPNYEVRTEDCCTQIQIAGQDLDTAILSKSGGWLTPYNSGTDRANWTLSDFAQPKGSTDYGTASVTSSTTATLASDDPSRAYASGFWPGVSGVLVLTSPAGGDAAYQTARAVTVSSAMAAGGSMTVEWDSSNPLDFDTYTRYELVGQENVLALVDRLFWITDPSTGDVGLDTFIGANLRDRNPNGIPWANNGQVEPIYYAAAKVLWGLNTDAATVAERFPILEIPVDVKVIRSTGQVLLAEPACVVAAIQAGTLDALNLGYPSNPFFGAWYDLKVAVPYSRGPLIAQYPPAGGGVAGSGFQGSAYTAYGITETMVVPLERYTSRSMTAAMASLAQEMLLTMCDAEIEGSIQTHDLPAGFDPFTLGIAIEAVLPATSPLAGIPVPVRAHVIRWPNDGPDIRTCSFRLSNRKAPNSADRQHIPPHFTHEPSGGFVWAGGGGEGLDAGPRVVGRPEQRARRESIANDKFEATRPAPPRSVAEAEPSGSHAVPDAPAPPRRITLREQRAGDNDTTSGGG